MKKTFDDGKFLVEIKQSGEKEPVGIIIDIFNSKTEDLIDTYTYWYDDLK